jgi:hypothetical protein
MLVCTDVVLMPVASDRVCPGIDGFVVLWQEDDLRGTISVGRTAKAAAAESASQGFWSVQFDDGYDRMRLDGNAKPFAVIQHSYIAEADNPIKDGGPRTYQRLVTWLPPGRCTMSLTST